MSEPDTEMSWAEIADGLALWNEHKPQSAEDWVRIASAWHEHGESVEDVSHLFFALYKAVGVLQNIAGRTYADGSPLGGVAGELVALAQAALSPTDESETSDG